jgi:DNA-binding NarL/FixJ family response regulator
MTVPLKTRILIADDHAIVRRGLRLILDAEPDLEVVAEAGDGAEAIRLARETGPDLAILDVSMPLITGLQATTDITRAAPGVRVLILSMHDNEQYFFEALRVGASGYVLKSAVHRDLVEVPRHNARRAVLLRRRDHGAHPRPPRSRPAGRAALRRPADPA